MLLPCAQVLLMRVLRQVVAGETGVALDAFGDANRRLFQQRGLSVLAKCSSGGSSSCEDDPFGSPLPRVVDLGTISDLPSSPSSHIGSTQTVLLDGKSYVTVLHALAPSAAEAEEWRHAFDVSGSPGLRLLLSGCCMSMFLFWFVCRRISAFVGKQPPSRAGAVVRSPRVHLLAATTARPLSLCCPLLVRWCSWHWHQ